MSPYRAMFIDDQAQVDLCYGAIAEPTLAKTNEALRRALWCLWGEA